MTDQQPAIRLSGLTKEFGAVTAVDHVDLEIGAGQFFSMLGPSGSGKTTVLRLIAGFEQPTAGTIELFGQDVTKKAPFDRDVNTVFQDYALFPHMSVVDNVAYGLKVRGVGRAERRRRAMKALEAVRLEQLAARRPAQLSGGQRQRVALARATVVQPKVLLLDEPLGALDLKLREQMQVELQQIQRAAGITFVLVTHDQDEALTLADRIVVFDAGRVEQVGPAREVYERPATPFVAGFVGTSNLLRPDAAHALLGRDGTWSVRPEKIGLTGASDDPPPDTTTAVGTVSEIVYTGATTRCLVALDAPDLAEAARLTVLLVNDGHRRQAPERGESVRLFWRPEHEIPVAAL
jgi:putative spermidine/putrescine transport system ATP-binding protein